MAKEDEAERKRKPKKDNEKTKEEKRMDKKRTNARKSIADWVSFRTHEGLTRSKGHKEKFSPSECNMRNEAKWRGKVFYEVVEFGKMESDWSE